jgi:hypothetical protein
MNIRMKQGPFIDMVGHLVSTTSGDWVIEIPLCDRIETIAEFTINDFWFETPSDALHFLAEHHD